MKSTVTFLFLLIAFIAPMSCQSEAETLDDQPVLTVDPGVHTGRIQSVAISDSGKFAVTGSFDKTIRLWDLVAGKSTGTLRMPAATGNIGKVFAVATNPAGDLVAVGGWTSDDGAPESIYLVDPKTQTITVLIGELPDAVNKLVFSKDGRFLAAAVGGAGLRIYDKEKQWAEVFKDASYHDQSIYGLSFANDGRLATAAYDRKIRLYGPGPDFSFAAPPKDVPGLPYEVAFRPDDEVLAVGYSNPAVDFLDGRDLHTLPGPKTAGIDEKLGVVTWTRDGSKLLIGGGPKIFIWDNAGLGEVRSVRVADDTIMSICTSDDGGILVAAAGPLLELLDIDGHVRWKKITPIARLGSGNGVLGVSQDGSIVDFGYESSDHPLIRFDMRKLVLTRNPPTDGLTTPPRTIGIPIKNWRNSFSPTFDDKKMELEDSEEFRSLAVSPDSQRFVFGTTWTLRGRDASNKPVWHRDMGDVWAVNISGDGRWVIAAYDDGTIRWHRLDNGQELLALMVLNEEDDYKWVAWTPEGYYFAQGASGVLEWSVNPAADKPNFGTTVSVDSIDGYNRPDVLPIVLDTMDVSRAVDRAKRAADKEAVRKATGMAKRPGASLHVLAVGIDYPNSKSLKLKYPEQDASDLLSRLASTQGAGSGLYASVTPHFLNSASATRANIIAGLTGMEAEMHADDVAVVMFSGHGMLRGNQLYLLTSDINVLAGTAGIAATGLSAVEFQLQIEQLALKGRVLVLLDACYSGKMTDAAPAPDAKRLTDAVSTFNTTVLTSSSKDQQSEEKDEWGHGAFTRVLLDALSGADSNHNGIITVDELTDYLNANLGPLTKNTQTLVVSNHAPGDLFVTGF